MLKIFVLCALAVCSLSRADQAESFTLNNGMKVCLKTTPFEPGEVQIRLMARGGFSGFEPSERASAELAPHLALGSGLGNLSYTQLQALLYEHSIEFESRVQPFYRVIDGSCSSLDAPLLLNLMCSFFSSNRFDQKFFLKLVDKTRANLRKHSQDQARRYEEIYLFVNHSNYPALQWLNEAHLDLANFEESVRLFKKSFSNPKEFVAVIVGDFDRVVMKELLEKILGQIEPLTEEKGPSISQAPPAFEGVKKHIEQKSTDGKTVTRLTFPIKLELTADHIAQVEIFADLINERLCKRVKVTGSIKSVIEFPFYPVHANPFLVIEHRSSSKQTTDVNQAILTELSRLQREGVSDIEVENAKQRRNENLHLAMNENDFWIMVLSNELLWGWALESAALKEGETFNKNLTECFSLDHYSIVSITL